MQTQQRVPRSKERRIYNFIAHRIVQVEQFFVLVFNHACNKFCDTFDGDVHASYVRRDYSTSYPTVCQKITSPTVKLDSDYPVCWPYFFVIFVVVVGFVGSFISSLQIFRRKKLQRGFAVLWPLFTLVSFLLFWSEFVTGGTITKDHYSLAATSAGLTLQTS